MDKLFELLLQQGKFEGLNPEGMAWSFTDEQIKTMPDFPDEQAIKEDDKYQLWITIQPSGVVNLEATFVGSVLHRRWINQNAVKPDGTPNLVTVEDVLSFIETANWSIDSNPNLQEQPNG